MRDDVHELVHLPKSSALLVYMKGASELTWYGSWPVLSDLVDQTGMDGTYRL